MHRSLPTAAARFPFPCPQAAQRRVCCVAACLAGSQYVNPPRSPDATLRASTLIRPDLTVITRHPAPAGVKLSKVPAGATQASSVNKSANLLIVRRYRLIGGVRLTGRRHKSHFAAKSAATRRRRCSWGFASSAAVLAASRST